LPYQVLFVSVQALVGIGDAPQQLDGERFGMSLCGTKIAVTYGGRVDKGVVEGIRARPTLEFERVQGLRLENWSD
jgi:hypothetical protein